MKCPACGLKTHVYSTRDNDREVYRCRNCVCGWKGTTRETLTGDADSRASMKNVLDLLDQLKETVKNMAPKITKGTEN